MTKNFCTFAVQNPRKDAGVVDRDGLENRCTLTGTQGSNPCLSANTQVKSAVSQQLTVDLILYTYKNTYNLKGNPSPIQMRQYHGKSKGGKIILRVFIEDNKVS